MKNLEIRKPEDFLNLFKKGFKFFVITQIHGECPAMRDDYEVVSDATIAGGIPKALICKKDLKEFLFFIHFIDGSIVSDDNEVIANLKYDAFSD